MPCQIPVPTAEQADLLLRRCAALVIDTVRGSTLVPPDLGAMNDWQVDGAFVSLHRGHDLRGCCGMVGGPHRLPDCLKRAAWRTACDDPRFPAVSEAELSSLNLEVHLLHSWQPCKVAAAQRPEQIVIGRDGLVLRRGNAAGLLLPVVATSHGWDAPTFLAQCCAKAGLSADAWRDDAIQLEIFQAHYLRADLADLGAA